MRKELDLPSIIMLVATSMGLVLPTIYFEVSTSWKLVMFFGSIGLGLLIVILVARVDAARQVARKAKRWLVVVAVGVLAGFIISSLATLPIVSEVPLRMLLMTVYLFGVAVTSLIFWLAFRFQVVKAEATPLPYSLVDNLSPDQIVFPGASDGREIKADYAICGEQPMRAIWAHPPVAGDTVIRYRVKTSPGGRYLLYFSIGIRDGARMSPGNQVEFIVRVDGGEVFKQRISATKWQSRLPRPGHPFVAREEFMTIELVTNALGNNAYNWAVWGEPILVEALSAQG